MAQTFPVDLERRPPALDIQAPLAPPLAARTRPRRARPTLHEAVQREARNGYRFDT